MRYSGKMERVLAMAISLDSLVGLLERWGRWKRVNETPERVDQLETTVRQLERRLSDLGDGKLLCSQCGKGPVSIEARTEPFGNNGQRQIIYRTCPDCGTIDKIDGAVLRNPEGGGHSTMSYDPQY